MSADPSPYSGNLLAGTPSVDVPVRGTPANSVSQPVNTPVPPRQTPITQPVEPVQQSLPPSNLDFITNQRDVGEFDKAKRHSGRVKYLKIILPAIGALVIAGFAGAMILRNSEIPDLDIGAVSLDNGNLVMKNPVLNGMDSKQRPYNLTADKAIQNAKTPSRIKLDAIKAKLPMEDGDFANITAGNGEYNTDAKTLFLGGDVLVKTGSGMEIQLIEADLDLDNGNMVTNKGVKMNSREADISSQELKVEKNGDLIIFERKVRLTLYPTENAEATKSENQ